MLKKCFILSIFAIIYFNVYGQSATKNISPADSVIYYFKNPNILISEQEKPDYIRVICPPDVNIDKNLWIVKEYYANGKLKMAGNCISSVNQIFVGPYIEFFSDGKRKSTGSFAKVALTEKQRLIGINTQYYPSGKLLSIRDYLDGTKYKLIECRDTTGNLMADKGKGKWREYSLDFKNISREGPIINGLEEGEWHEHHTDTINYVTNYKKGKLISGVATTPSGKQYTFTEMNVMPKLRGKNTEYFFKNNFRCDDLKITYISPFEATATFKIDENGTLSEVKLKGGTNDSGNSETLRVINKSANEWTPAYQNGIPVATECEIRFYVTSQKIPEKEGEPETYKYFVTVNMQARAINW